MNNNKTRKLGEPNYSEGVFGIDLGTTNSAIALVSSGNTPEVIPLIKADDALAEGYSGINDIFTMPSVVAWLGGDNFEVGHKAYLHKYDENVAYSMKRKIGRDNDSITLKYNGEEREFTATDIATQVLKKLCEYVEPYYGKIRDVVITVPAYFDNRQVEETRKAGERIGLNVLSTFREPTSGALNYAILHPSKREQRVMVYDLGGGTFDVSLVKIINDEDDEVMDKIYGFTHHKPSGEESSGIILDVLRKDGDSHLGGDDIDDELVKIALNKYRAKGVDVDNLTDKTLEYLKYRLSGLKNDGGGSFELPYKLELNDGTTLTDICIPFNDNDFYKATKIIYDRTKKCVDNTLQGEPVDAIILVGGSTKSAHIRRLLAEDYPTTLIDTSLNPDEAVALGAASQAKRLKYGSGNIKVFDILPISIGILTGIKQNKIRKLIDKDTPLPYSKTERFMTVEEGQTQIHVNVYQGNSVIPEECTNLGRLEINDIPVKEDEKASVDVTLTVNTDGVLSCRAKVGDIEKECVLVNILKGETVKAKSKEDKRIIRWRRRINDVEDKEIRDNLLSNLAEVEEGRMSVKDFTAIMREHI